MDSYFIKGNKYMDDICMCCSGCANTDCARNAAYIEIPVGEYFSMSDFSLICSSYVVDTGVA